MEGKAVICFAFLFSLVLAPLFARADGHYAGGNFPNSGSGLPSESAFGSGRGANDSTTPYESLRMPAGSRGAAPANEAEARAKEAELRAAALRPPTVPKLTIALPPAPSLDLAISGATAAPPTKDSQAPNFGALIVGAGANEKASPLGLVSQRVGNADALAIKFAAGFAITSGGAGGSGAGGTGGTGRTAGGTTGGGTSAGK